MAVTGASLTPIYERLNAVDNYRPFDAETFSDWATEAGDKISIYRDGTGYVVPVHTTRMVWKGAPEMVMSTTGQRERDPVARVSKRKYGRGSGGMRNNEEIHKAMYDSDGYLRSVLDYTESHLTLAFQSADASIRGALQMTESRLRTDFGNDITSLHSEFEMTASHWRTEFNDTKNSLHSEIVQTASVWRNNLDDAKNSLHSEIVQTASVWRSNLDDAKNSLHSEILQTASVWRNNLDDAKNSLHSEVQQTASNWRSSVSGIAGSDGRITAATIAIAINNAGSEAIIDADKVYIGNQKSTTVINGKIQLADVTATYIATQIETLSNLLATKVTVGEVDASTVYISPVYGMGRVSVATGYNGSNLTLNGNTYTLRLVKFNGQYDDWTFSRATQLSGSWSGRNYTVTATPQGNIKQGTVYEEIVPDTSDAVVYNATTKQLSRKFYVYSDDDGDAGSVILHRTVSIPGDLAYAAGFTDGSSSGGTTALTNTWSSGIITVTASPQGEQLKRQLAQLTATWSGTRVTIPIESRHGSTFQYSEGTVYSPSVDVSGKLQTKSVSSNGTYTPDSGYIGFSSVAVAVPATDAKARFNATAGVYYIEAFDNVSGNPISGSNVNYKLGLNQSAGSYTSGAKVQVQNNSGVQISGTHELALSSYWTAASTSGYNSAAIVESWSGGTLTITKGSGTYQAKEHTVTATPSITYNSSTHKYTATAQPMVDGTARGNSSSTTGGTEGYDAGWKAYYDKWKYPVANNPVNDRFTVYWPSKTPDSAYDGISRTYVLSSDNNVAYIKYGSTTMAQWTHNKYNNGWTAARDSTGNFPTTTPGSVPQSITVKRPNATAGGTADSYTYYVTSGKNDAYIRYGGTNTTIVATVNHGQYNAGWHAAYNQISLPSNGTGPSMTLYTTSSAVDGTRATTTYSLVVDNNVAYIKDGNNVKAQVTHNKYNTGYNANRSGWIAYGKGSATSNQGYLGEGNYIHAYTVDINGTAHDSAGFWWVPSAWFRYVSGAGSNHQGDLASDSYIELIYTNSSASGDVRGTGATWHVPSSGGGTSHSITQSHAYADNLATLANNLGASSSSSLTSLGTFPAAGGRNYWGIRVKCGSATKYYYVHTT